jgi:hypothetical protein
MHKLSSLGYDEFSGESVRVWRIALSTQCFNSSAAYRINSFCVVAFLTAASGMPVSNVTSLRPR